MIKWERIGRKEKLYIGDSKNPNEEGQMLA